MYMEKRGKVGIITLEGRLDASNIGDLKKNFSEYIKDTVEFVFDLSKVDFIDSTGLGGLVSCLKNASQMGGDVYVTGLSSKTKIIFDITRANKIFSIFDDVESAVESFEEE